MSTSPLVEHHRIDTVVISVIFPRLIEATPESRTGNLRCSLSLSITIPGAALRARVRRHMDYTAAKSVPLAATILTVLTTSSLYYVTPARVYLGMFLIVISNKASRYRILRVELPDQPRSSRDLGKISATRGVSAISAASFRRRW